MANRTLFKTAQSLVITRFLKPEAESEPSEHVINQDLLSLFCDPLGPRRKNKIHYTNKEV